MSHMDTSRSSLTTASSTISSTLTGPLGRRMMTTTLKPSSLGGGSHRNTRRSKGSGMAGGMASARSMSRMNSAAVGNRGRAAFIADYQPQVIVRDEQGKDVTPQSLLTLQASVLQQHTLLLGSSAAPDPAPLSRTESVDDFDRMSMASSSIGRSMFESLSSRSALSNGSSTARTWDSVDPSPRVAAQPQVPASTSMEAPKPPAKLEILLEKDVLLEQTPLESPVTLILEETPTIWLLDFPGACLEKDGPDAPEVTTRNEAYKAMLARRKTETDNFSDRGVQTLTVHPKSKDAQVTPAKTKEFGVQSTGWDIYDSFQKSTTDTEVSTQEDAIGRTDRNTAKLMAELDKTPGAWLEIDNAPPPPDGVPSETAKEKEIALMQSPKLLETLLIAERMVLQNIYHERHLSYRGLDWLLTNIAPKEDGAPSLQYLWSFQCEFTQNRNVSCLAWNHANADILAAGYGQFEYSKQRDGLVLCWSLKNPQYPLRVIKTKVGVTAIGFSRLRPNLLAVGLYDGSVAVYNLRHRNEGPVVSSNQTEFKHLDPVWEVQWVDRGDERGEMLVSVSTDGRVAQWTIKKGLEYSELMKLKLVSPHGKSDSAPKKEHIISRQAGGLCFDFNKEDSNIYVVGTEDGMVHKCSCSYNEQYLLTYYGHSGPVYKIHWSPFAQNVFLTCSADWTVRLWDSEVDSAAFTFKSVNNSITDVVWSPTEPTVFVSVNDNKSIEVWDLEVSTLDPHLSFSVPEVPSCALFSQSAPVLLTGDASGAITVYKLCNFAKPPAATNNKQETPGEKLLRVMRESKEK